MSLNILHIDTEVSWRGGQNQTKLLISGLSQRGVPCHLVANSGSALANALEGQIPTLCLPLRSGFSLRAAKQIADYCKKSKITHLDAQTSKAHGIALLVKYFCPQLKLTVHRRVDYPPANNFLSKLKYNSQKIDCYVAISNAIGKVLSDYGIDEQKIRVIRSSISPLRATFANKKAAKFTVTQKLGLRPDIPLIGNASALTDQKDYPTLFRALARLRTKGIAFNCIIAGEGKLKFSLERLVAELRLEDSVYFLGFREDVTDLLQALDVLTITSQNEGLGTVILDAAQLSTCIVATSVGGIPEIIETEKTGLLAPVKNSELYANQLQRTLENESLRNELGLAAKAWVLTKFSTDQMIEGNLAVYRSL